MAINHETDSLSHHGIKGMRWGVRRYQNKDGSLTPLGERRMGIKSTADKKAIEDLRERRATRRINISKQRQAMFQETLDRMHARSMERAKIKLAQKKAKEESANAEASRKLAKDKQRLEEQKQKQDALDRENNRKLAKDKQRLEEQKQKQLEREKNAAIKLAKDKFKAEREDANRDYDIPDEEYYELPDTPERQKSSGINGKKLAMGALAVAGTVAVAVAAKKYGPALLEKLKNSKAADTVKDVAKKAKDTADKDGVSGLLSEAKGSVAGLLAAPTRSGGKTNTSASTSNTFRTMVENAKKRNARRSASSSAYTIFKEASKYHGVKYDTSTPVAGLLSAPSSSSKSTVDTVSSVMNTIGDIPLFMGS